MISTILLIIALICFLAAVVDWPPPVSAVRLIALGLFLWLLATLISSGVK